MSADLQKRFRELAKGERVYVGGKFATQNDLAALFTVRAASLYLRSGGRIAFVLPLAALTRGQFEKFRKGSFTSARIAWDEAWTMDDDVQPLFPVPSCVVFGRRRATAKALPDKVRAYSGQLPMRDASEAVADASLTVRENAPKPAEGRFTGGSAYRKIISARCDARPTHVVFGRAEKSWAAWAAIRPRPSSSVAATVRKNSLGNPWPEWSIASKRSFFTRYCWVKASCLIGYGGHSRASCRSPPQGHLLDAEAAANRGYAGLHGWMSAAEAIWNANAESGSMTLTQRWNYHNELGAQFPIPRTSRGVCEGWDPCRPRCLVRGEATIDHMLYWASPRSESEGFYLAAILNSETSRARVAATQARGQWGARHFDKVMFTLPIPPFDASQPLHTELAAAASEAERIAAAFDLPGTVKFQRARRLIRDALTEFRPRTAHRRPGCTAAGSIPHRPR